MRPQTLALPPVAPNGLTNTLQNAGGANRRAVLTWNDNSITETSFAGAALHQPGQHLDHHRDDQLAAQPGQHPPDEDLHRHLDVQPDHHDALLPRGRPEHRRLRGRHGVPADDGDVAVQHPRRRPAVHHHGQRGRRRHASRRPARSPWAAAAARRSPSRRTPATASPGAGGRRRTTPTAVVDRHLHVHQRARPTTPSRHVHAERRRRSPRAPGPAAASRRTARRRWRSTAARRTRSRRTTATRVATVLVDGVNNPAAVTSARTRSRT